MTLKIAIAQCSPALGDVRKNLADALSLIENAHREKCGLIVFPELALTGYFLRDLTMEVAEDLESETINTIKNASKDIDILIGFAELSKQFHAYISAGYFSKGEILHVHRKIYLPTYGMFEDMRYFAHGERIRAFDTAFARTGILICEDALHPLLSYVLAMDGAIVFHVISNSPLRGLLKNEADSIEKWEETLRFISRIYGVYVIYTNRSGFEDGVQFGGNSFIADPHGQITIRGKKGEDDFIVTTIALEEISRARTRLPLVRDENIPLALKELERIYRECK